MSMTYTSLVAPKGTAGSVANWVGYTKLDLPTIVDEAQSLIYSMLRVREMRTEWTFGVAVGQSKVALPARFLDPIGKIFDMTNSTRYSHRLEGEVLAARSYDPSVSGTYGANPFTTASGSSLVTCIDVAHGLTQGSSITNLAASAVGGLTLTGSFAVASITDDDTFVIDAVSEATSTATGGGSSATWTGNKLISSLPSSWSVWDDCVQFDVALELAFVGKLQYFRAPKLLAETTNESNWLVDRYPNLMRKACQAAAADFMKDTEEYNKALTALTALINVAAQENDLIYRGAEFGTDNP